MSRREPSRPATPAEQPAEPHAPHSRRRRRQQQRADRRAAAAAVAAKATRREQQLATLRRILNIGVPIAVVVAIDVLFAVTGHSTSPGLLIPATLCGLVLVAGGFAFGWLRPQLGRLTALLALGLVSGLLFASIALASPDCPGATLSGRCSGAEVANWAGAGLLLPLAYGMLIGLPFVCARLLVRLAVAWTRIVRGTSAPSAAGPRALLDRFRTR